MIQHEFYKLDKNNKDYEIIKKYFYASIYKDSIDKQLFLRHLGITYQLTDHNITSILLDKHNNYSKILMQYFSDCVYNGFFDFIKFLSDVTFKNDTENAEKSIFLIPWIEERINSNRNVLAIFVGQTGSGKSYSAISLAEQIDPNFNVDRIVFTASDFMALATSDNIPKGSVIIWDDAGVNLSNKSWMSLSNKIIGKVVQNFRYRNLILMLTVPSASFVDKTVRSLIHIYFESTGKQGIMRPFMLSELYRGSGEIAYKYPTKVIDGVVNQFNRINFVLPSKPLIKAYEDKKQAYMEMKNKEFAEEIKEAELNESSKSNKTKNKKVFKPVKKAINNNPSDKRSEIKNKIIELHKKGLSVRQISKKVKMSIFTVSKTISGHHDPDEIEKKL